MDNSLTLRVKSFLDKKITVKHAFYTLIINLINFEKIKPYISLMSRIFFYLFTILEYIKSFRNNAIRFTLHLKTTLERMTGWQGIVNEKKNQF